MSLLIKNGESSTGRANATPRTSSARTKPITAASIAIFSAPQRRGGDRCQREISCFRGFIDPHVAYLFAVHGDVFEGYL